MRKIIPTGYTDKEFIDIYKKKLEPGCYICKRREDDKAVFMIEDSDGEEDIGSLRLDYGIVKINKGDVQFKFRLCYECSTFLEAFIKSVGKIDLSLTKRSVN